MLRIKLKKFLFDQLHRIEIPVQTKSLTVELKKEKKKRKNAEKCRKLPDSLKSKWTLKVKVKLHRKVFIYFEFFSFASFWIFGCKRYPFSTHRSTSKKKIKIYFANKLFRTIINFIRFEYVNEHFLAYSKKLRGKKSCALFYKKWKLLQNWLTKNCWNWANISLYSNGCCNLFTIKLRTISHWTVCLNIHRAGG